MTSPGPVQMYCNDGTGLGGTGNWRFPPPGARDTLGRLRKRLLEMAVSWLCRTALRRIPPKLLKLRSSPTKRYWPSGRLFLNCVGLLVSPLILLLHLVNRLFWFFLRVSALSEVLLTLS